MVRAGGGCDVIFPFKGIHDPNHRQIEDALQEFVTNPEETIKQVFQQADNDEE